MSETPKRFPLHFQILAALIVGTIVGIIVNPGSITEDDAVVAVDITVTRDAPEDADLPGELEVQVVDENHFETLNRHFKTDQEAEAAFPELKGILPEKGQSFAAQTDIKVANIEKRIVKTMSSYMIDYMRTHNGATVSTSVKAASIDELPDHWQPLAKQHGDTFRRNFTSIAKFVGDLFLRMLKMITVPLIITSLITGVAGLGNSKQLGRMFGRTLLYYAVTSMLAIVTGLVIVNLIRPGIGANLPGGTEQVLAGEDESLGGILVGLLENLIPTNPIAAVANGDFLSIITFSILFGVFLIRTGGPTAEFLRQFFRSCFEVIMNMTLAIIRLAPIGVLGFMIYATSSQGMTIFITLAWYMLAVFLSLVIHAGIVLPLLVKFVAKRSPLEYAKAMSPALMTAFSTASSNGTLPLTISCVEQRAGVSSRVSSFVLPLGATINMDGTALYEVVAVLFIAQAYHGDVTIAQQVVVAITALLASIGAAGIPHAGLVMMAIVLQAVNLPLEAQGIIIAVDRVLDMCRTSVNVWSDACGCAVISRFDQNDAEVAEDENNAE
jgi:Na+/H+-dicarboxylate symporter